MGCALETPRLEVEIGDTIYEIEFGQIQIEITGRCNMTCQHCRASHQLRQDMPLSQIIKIIRFARQFSPNYKEVIVSGGEPLLHREFDAVLRGLRDNGGEFITLTTNGLALSDRHLDLIAELAFERFVLSVSLDSLVPAEHDTFRNHIGAYEHAVRALRLVTERGVPNVVASMRSTIVPSRLGMMEEMVAFADSLGCTRVSFSSVHPSGRAADRADFWMTPEQKHVFIRNIYGIKGRYPHINVTTNDPLKCIVRGASDIGGDDELVFDGCGAGAITFNVNADGVMTPCALLDIPMMDTSMMSIEQMTEAYRRDLFVRHMLTMNLKGKCGVCDRKFQCGGCRARAFGQCGDPLAEDPQCWLPA